jgi:hypothetical protein
VAQGEHARLASFETPTHQWLDQKPQPAEQREERDQPRYALTALHHDETDPAGHETQQRQQPWDATQKRDDTPGLRGHAAAFYDDGGALLSTNRRYFELLSSGSGNMAYPTDRSSSLRVLIRYPP